MKTTINKHGELKVIIDSNDICYHCLNFKECPLYGALTNEIVIQRFSENPINQCGMYKERNLTRILNEVIW